VNGFYVRNADGGMVPLSTFLTVKAITAAVFERFNVYRAATIMARPLPINRAPARRNRRHGRACARAARRLSGSNERRDLPGEEDRGSPAASSRFPWSFVFLVLAALYESWAMPVAILLVIPFGVLGAFLGLFCAYSTTMWYTQIGLIMLIGLAAKKRDSDRRFAKLARDARQADPAIRDRGRPLRLRPHPHDIVRVHPRSLPLAIGLGAGAGARQAIAPPWCSDAGRHDGRNLFHPGVLLLLQRLSERKSPFRGEEPSRLRTRCRWSLRREAPEAVAVNLRCLDAC